MRTIMKSLLISSSLLVTVQQSQAEQLPSFPVQAPIWNFGQTPIAWGDCVPVPVVSVPYGQNNMQMGQMGMNQAPMMQPFPMPMNEPTIILAPPSPFFNAAIPAPAPLQPVLASATSCDHSALKALQERYDQGAAASITKITEITQALTDSNNQMADARVIIDNLSKKSEQRNSKLGSELSMLGMQLTNIRNKNISLQAKLTKAQSTANEQARKINALKLSTTEFNALKSAYKDRSDETAILKDRLMALDNGSKSLQAKISMVEATASAQARKITVLNQSSAELTALQSAYKTRNNENVELKKRLASLDGAYKTLQAQLTTAKTDVGSQARKLTVLSQSSNELTALKSAYKARNDENVTLKKMLADLDNAHKSLKAQYSVATKDASDQARKLTVLGQSATELSAIQSAYKEKVNQNISLKTELAELDLLKSSLNSCRAEVSELGMKLTNTDNKRKSLSGEIATLESKISSQARKITSLMLATKELDALKSAYKDLSSKKVELTSKLTAATADTDNDGVLDSLDKCPSSPVGTKVNEMGCPSIVDTDGDGVADTSDLCTTTPAGAKVNEFGCEKSQNITLKGVNFDTGSARLTPSSLPIISAAAATLNNNPKINVEISGYTDNQGVSILNERLSQRRANTVMIQLIKDGVEATRLKAKGYGEKNPIANNRTANGRATNRRVELKISK